LWRFLHNRFSCLRNDVEAGYRHLDCAEGYENEEFVGRAIKDSGVARDTLWVTTKVAPESFGPGQIRPHVEASLEKLGVGPVDLLLLHYPSATASQIALAWLLSEGHIIIPSAGSKGRIAENLAAGEITLTDAERAEIASLNRDMRLVNGPWCPVWDVA